MDFSPSGLTFTTDEMLYSLLGDIENWKANLPEHLRFHGPETSLNAGASWLRIILPARLNHSYRILASPIFLRVYDVLACLHAN